MIKKIFCLFAIALIALNVSCKKDGATELIDENSIAVPPASPDSVIAPEPNISAAPATTADTPPPPPPDGKYPKMTFASNEHDFGTINKGDKVDYAFTFKNTGEADLIITNAKGSCGCTIPEYPKEPIKPGESGKIKVSFNSAGKNGQQHKTVTLTTNTASGKETLDVKASIKEPENK